MAGTYSRSSTTRSPIIFPSGELAERRRGGVRRLHRQKRGEGERRQLEKGPISPLLGPSAPSPTLLSPHASVTGSPAMLELRRPRAPAPADGSPALLSGSPLGLGASLLRPADLRPVELPACSRGAAPRRVSASASASPAAARRPDRQAPADRRPEAP